jgi:YjcQ protein.
MDSMKIVYKILEHLDKSMDDEIVDPDPISAETLGVTRVRRYRIISMMIDAGLIDGFRDVGTLGSDIGDFKMINPSITLLGLQYLSENTASSKIYRAAKEIRDWIPGM